MFGLRESLLTQGAVEFKMCCIFCDQALHIHASTETWVSCNYHDKTTEHQNKSGRSRSCHNLKKIKDRNRRAASEMRTCDNIGSTLFFMVIISATHKPVQSGLLKLTQLAQAGRHRSSHWVCQRGQNTCRQISPIIQSVSQKAWLGKQNRGKGNEMDKS